MNMFVMTLDNLVLYFFNPSFLSCVIMSIVDQRKVFGEKFFLFIGVFDVKKNGYMDFCDGSFANSIICFLVVGSVFIFLFHTNVLSQTQTLNSDETIISVAKEQLEQIKNRVENTPYDDLVFEFPQTPVYINGYNKPKLFSLSQEFVLSYYISLGDEKFLDSNVKERSVMIHVIAETGVANRDFQTTVIVKSDPEKKEEKTP